MVRQYHIEQFDELWQSVENGSGEGIVAVRKNATIGARRAKLKCKPVDTLDAQVVQLGRSVALVQWCGIQFTVSRRSRKLEGLAVRDWVEIEYERLYQDRTPRFPRITQIRYDLQRVG
jgi:hypothetical protein